MILLELFFNSKVLRAPITFQVTYDLEFPGKISWNFSLGNYFHSKLLLNQTLFVRERLVPKLTKSNSFSLFKMSRYVEHFLESIFNIDF